MVLTELFRYYGKDCADENSMDFNGKKKENSTLVKAPGRRHGT